MNAQDEVGLIPLHFAAKNGCTQLCALLLQHGADVTLKNKHDQTPLHLASADEVKCILAKKAEEVTF